MSPSLLLFFLLVTLSFAHNSVLICPLSNVPLKSFLITLFSPSTFHTLTDPPTHSHMATPSTFSCSTCLSGSLLSHSFSPSDSLPLPTHPVTPTFASTHLTMSPVACLCVSLQSLCACPPGLSSFISHVGSLCIQAMDKDDPSHLKYLTLHAVKVELKRESVAYMFCPIPSLPPSHSLSLTHPSLFTHFMIPSSLHLRHSHHPCSSAQSRPEASLVTKFLSYFTHSNSSLVTVSFRFSLSKKYSQCISSSMSLY